MLDAYLFDEHHAKKIEAWADALDDRDDSQVLWLDRLEPGRFHEEGVQPAFDQAQEYLRVIALAARDAEADASETVAVDCFVGENWVLTAHSTELAVIEDFRAWTEGEGKIGILDAPSFLAVLMEWVVTSYLRAFDKIEVELEEFDVRVLRSARRDAERQIS